MVSYVEVESRWTLACKEQGQSCQRRSVYLWRGALSGTCQYTLGVMHFLAVPATVCESVVRAFAHLPHTGWVPLCQLRTGTRVGRRLRDCIRTVHQQYAVESNGERAKYSTPTSISQLSTLSFRTPRRAQMPSFFLVGPQTRTVGKLERG